MEVKKRKSFGSRPARPGFGSQYLTAFDDFFKRDLFEPSFGNSGVSIPAVNIIDTPDDFRVEMVAPGMRKEAFKVELDNHILTISYDHEDNREGERKEWKYMVHEYNYHSFTRSFYLPDIVEADKIEARYHDGVLTLIIPKKEEAKPKPSKQISIE
jgi:HSP20 family protein